MRTRWRSPRAHPVAWQLSPGSTSSRACLRLGGNTLLLRSLLLRLSEDVAVFGPNLRHDLASGDHKRAAAQLHTLRGGAATLGADDLAALANDIESQLLAGRFSELSGKIDALETNIAVFRAAVARAFAQPSDIGETPAT